MWVRFPLWVQRKASSEAFFYGIKFLVAEQGVSQGVLQGLSEGPAEGRYAKRPCEAPFAESCATSFEEYRNIAIYKYEMGATKSDLFNKKQNETASLLKAIAHPARIAIVEYLMNVESCICGDIVNKLPLAQPTVSQHLKELKSAGIIQGSIEGNSICYCLNEKTIQKLKVYFETIENKISKQNKCC